MLQITMKISEDSKSCGKRILAQLLGVETLPEMAKTIHKKPFFVDKSLPHFNISHSDELALVGISQQAVGVDVENIRPRKKFLPRKTLSDQEYDWFVHRGSQWCDFYSLWVLKEAKVKERGTGLTLPIREIKVPLLEVGQCVYFDGRWFSLFGTEQWRGAVCGCEPCQL